MADRWMDERDREWRERDWRRSEAYGRGGADRGRGAEPRRYGEERSWAEAGDDEEARYDELRRRRESYGEREADYGGRSSVTGGGAQPYGQPYGTRPDYDYARSYRADRDREERRAWRAEGHGYGREHEPSYGEEFSRVRSGAYGPERGYRAGGRGAQGRESGDERGTGDFLQRAGERISSWFRGGRDEAADDARRYEGRDDDDYRRIARGHRGRGPRGYQRTDERISEDVNDRLTEDPWLDASDIEVTVKAGEVTLDGHVDNREAKHRAERLVEDLSGVRHVQNNLRVDPNAGFTGAGRGFGSSALEAEMRRNELATSQGNEGVSGPGRTSAGAAAERSTGPAADQTKPT